MRGSQSVEIGITGLAHGGSMVLWKERGGAGSRIRSHPPIGFPNSAPSIRGVCVQEGLRRGPLLLVLVLIM